MVNLAKADMFALGVLLFTMVVGCPPFRRATDSDPYYKYFMRGTDEGLESFWNKHPSSDRIDSLHDSEGFKDLINSLLSADPKQRPTCDELAAHTWLHQEEPVHSDEILALTCQ